MSNVKILRLNNCSGNPNVENDVLRSGFSYRVNSDLVNQGRCLVEVISGWSNITVQTIDAGGNVDTTSRIVPNNIPNLIVRTNILQEGEDTITGGGGLILGTICLTNTTPASATIAGSTTTNCGAFCQNDSFSFICERLPSQIDIERVYLKYSNDFDEIPIFLPATLPEFLPPIVPMEVVLKLTFIDEN
jgi:hypothetical protein